MMEELKNNINGAAGRDILNSFLSENFKNHAEMTEKFDILTDIYMQVLSTVNISAIKNIDDIYIKHYLDSIYPYKYFSGTCCDVGCGGGFPCIPLAIVTELRITGVESVGKKLVLLHRAVSELKLKNLKGDYARSEDLVKLNRSYDTVCARALADCDKSIAFCAPLAKRGGQILLYKTQNDTDVKQQTADKFRVKLKKTLDYTLPHTDINRRLYIYEKL